MGGWKWNLFFMQQVANRVTLASRLQILHVALVDDFSSQTAGVRTDVDDVVGCTDDFLIMFHYYNGISQLLQLAEHLDEAACIPAMQSDTWFVQNV